MGILIIDGNSVFEIDEECYKRKKTAKECEIDKYMKIENINTEHINTENIKSTNDS